MSIEVCVLFTDPKKVDSIHIGEEELLSMLGPEEDTMALQLSELLGAVKGKIADSVDVESDLTIEISGSVSLKVQAGVKYLFFNIGGGAESAGGAFISWGR